MIKWLINDNWGFNLTKQSEAAFLAMHMCTYNEFFEIWGKKTEQQIKLWVEAVIDWYFLFCIPTEVFLKRTKSCGASSDGVWRQNSCSKWTHWRVRWKACRHRKWWDAIIIRLGYVALTSWQYLLKGIHSAANGRLVRRYVELFFVVVVGWFWKQQKVVGCCPQNSDVRRVLGRRFLMLFDDQDGTSFEAYWPVKAPLLLQLSPNIHTAGAWRGDTRTIMEWQDDTGTISCYF